jgi:hypothetical protein
LIDPVAPSDSTVLTTDGAGKERVAKLIHARSSRRSRPLVVVEWAALQDGLLQSELPAMSVAPLPELTVPSRACSRSPMEERFSRRDWRNQPRPDEVIARA